MGTLRSLMFDWNADAIAELSRLFAEGLSFSQIAAAMRCGSRNAALGKVHRLGLTRAIHPSSANRAPYPKHRKPAKPRPVRHDRFRPAKIAASVVEPASVDDSAIPLAQRRALDQLTNVTCRWPVGTPGEPSFFFCGDESADLIAGRPYCPAHTKRASAGPGRAPDRYPWGRGRE